MSLILSNHCRVSDPRAHHQTRCSREVKKEVGILLPKNQRQHRTLHIQENVLPYALCCLLCPLSAALASMACLATSPGTPLPAKED